MQHDVQWFLFYVCYCWPWVLFKALQLIFSIILLFTVFVCFPFLESAKLAAADLHKASSLSFSLYKKRPALKVKVKRSVNANAAALLAGYQFDHSDLHVKEVARELVKNIPTYEGVIEVSIKKCNFPFALFFCGCRKSAIYFSIHHSPPVLPLIC